MTLKELKIFKTNININSKNLAQVLFIVKFCSTIPEYLSVSPLVGIGTPPPLLPQASVPPPPEPWEWDKLAFG